MEAGVLTVKGKKESEAKTEKEGYKRVERTFGSFYRRFSLPNSADGEAINANTACLRLLFQNGKLLSQNVLMYHRKNSAIPLWAELFCPPNLFEAFGFPMDSPSPAGEGLFILINSKGDPLRLFLPVRPTASYSVIG
jgi:hypothetical protein